MATLLFLGLWLGGAVWGAWTFGWHRILAEPPSLAVGMAGPFLLMLTGGLGLARQQRLAVALILGLLFGGTVLLVPNFLMARAQGRLTACRSNLKNIALALEMYASDNEGSYPPSLALLTRGNYLKAIPGCYGEDEDAAPVDSYSEGYQVIGPKSFQLCCKGLRHPKLVGRPDHPKL